MTLSRSFVRNAAMTPLDARLILASLITQNADGSTRTGVLDPVSSIVTTQATMNLRVAAAEFVASKGIADGATVFTNDGFVLVAVTAAPVANSRIDVLWVKHEDNTTGDAASLPIFGVTAGTAAASPTKPAIPTGALELATLQVFAGSTTTANGGNILTNTYQMTSLRGAPVPFRNATERNAWTTAVTGTIATTLDSAADARWDGSSWKTVPGGVFGGRQALAAQSIPNTTITKLAINNTSVFLGGTSAGTNGVTVPVAGWYEVNGYVLWAFNATGSRVLTIRVNDADAGGYLLRDVCQAVTAAATPTGQSTGGMIQLAAGDVVSIWGTQSSGGALDVTERQLTVRLVSAT